MSVRGAVARRIAPFARAVAPDPGHRENAGAPESCSGAPLTERLWPLRAGGCDARGGLLYVLLEQLTIQWTPNLSTSDP
jgi:hypothetical protein